MWEGSLVATAPALLGGDLLNVPTGAELELDLRLESVLDGVLVTADVTAPLDGECARCLEPVQDTITVSFTELWSYPEQADRYARTAGESLGDDEVYLLEGDRLDLEQAVRDAIVLALPARPLCRDDCAGLCIVCGERLDDLEPGHTHEQVDMRWAVLADLADAEPGAGTHD
jgi:uncharacterized protein